MIIEPEYQRPREPSLIEDVVSPHTEQFTDVGKEEVRRRSIGNLYRQYMRSKKEGKGSKLDYADTAAAAAPAVEPAKTTPKLRYTRVPPLQTLPSFSDMADDSAATLFTPEELAYNRRSWTSKLRDAAQDTKDWAVWQMSRARNFLAAGALAIFGSLPKHYNAESGIVINLRDRILALARVAVPVLAVLLLLAINDWTSSPPEASNSPSSTSKTSSQKSSSAKSQDKNASKESKASANTAASATPPASGAAVLPSAAGPSTAASPSAISSPQTAGTSTSLTGGRGGGTITPPSATTSPSSGGTLPLNTTLTIPPTDVQAGGKDLVNTSGTTIQVN